MHGVAGAEDRRHGRLIDFQAGGCFCRRECYLACSEQHPSPHQTASIQKRAQLRERFQAWGVFKQQFQSSAAWKPEAKGFIRADTVLQKLGAPACAPTGVQVVMAHNQIVFYAAIVQSLLVTCRLHDIDPYDYLVDVLQHVGQHPASLVEQLAPRVWKTLYASNPLRSDLYRLDEPTNPQSRQ